MKKISEKEFRDIINNEQGLVLIDFYADWCLPCKYLSQVLEKLEKEFKDIRFYKVNVEEARDLVVEYRISSIPTVLFFSKGKVVSGFVGAIPENDVRYEIKRILNVL